MVFLAWATDNPSPKEKIGSISTNKIISKTTRNGATLVGLQFVNLGLPWATSGLRSGFTQALRVWSIFLESGPRGNAREISPACGGLNAVCDLTLIL